MESFEAFKEKFVRYVPCYCYKTKGQVFSSGKRCMTDRTTTRNEATLWLGDLQEQHPNMIFRKFVYRSCVFLPVNWFAYERFMCFKVHETSKSAHQEISGEELRYM